MTRRPTLPRYPSVSQVSQSLGEVPVYIKFCLRNCRIENNSASTMGDRRWGGKMTYQTNPEYVSRWTFMDYTKCTPRPTFMNNIIDSIRLDLNREQTSNVLALLRVFRCLNSVVIRFKRWVCRPASNHVAQ